MGSALGILLAMAIWGALHSVTASLKAKAIGEQWLGKRTSEGFYRLVYNLLAGVTFLPVMATVALLPAQPLYTLPGVVLPVTGLLQLAATLMVMVVLVQVDLPRFLGLRQLSRWLQGQPDPRDTPRLNTAGVYGWVRHPLYFFSLVLLWLTPVMTTNVLAFNLGATLYFWVGSIYEERKLVAEFGEVYRQHQRRVPRLLPWPPVWQRRE